MAYPNFPRFKSTKDKGSDSLGVEGKSLYEFEFRVVKVFHMKNFYKFVYWYLTEEGWRAAEDEGEEDERVETFFEEWREPNGNMQRRIWWRLVYNPEFHSRGTSRYRYYMDLNFTNLFMRNTETVVGGRKMTAQEGELKVRVKVYIKIFDQDVKKHPLMGPILFHFFRKRWYKPIFEGYRNDIRVRARNLQDAMKDFFNVATFQEDQKNFHLERGL